MKKRFPGFTLMEVLLSIALVSLIFGIASPVVYSLKMENDLNVAVEYSLSAMRRAFLLSRASTNNTSWGVYTQTGTITLFQGTSYALRDVNYDEVMNIAGHITFAGVTEEVFAKSSGIPSASGNLRFSSSNNSIRAITITSDGAVYEY